MTPTKINIAIAEACGWTIERPKWAAPQSAGWWYHPHYNARKQHDLPDYLNDLNAMHEAEKVLNGTQQIDYCFTLMDIQNSGGGFKRLHATAAQRAEAFLKTLDLWKD